MLGQKMHAKTALQAAAFALVLVLGPGRALAATTYYVSATGSDTAAGTQAAPWASIAHAQSVVAAGDTVYFRGGTYAYSAGVNTCGGVQTATVNAIVLNKSGSANNSINYFASPGETPVFDFSGMKDDCRVKGFLVSGSYIHLKGLEVTGVPQNNNKNHESWGVWVSGSNNVFELLDTHHNMGPGLFIQNGGGNLVLNCDSHHNYDPMTSNGAGQSADGFGCHISAGGTGNVFRGCRAWMNSDDGYDLINAFEAVVIENSWSWQHGYLPGTTTAVAAGNGNGFKAGGYGDDPSTFPANAPKHTVRNCVAFANKAAGFYANHHPVSGFFYNNTSYGNHPDFNMLGMNPSGADITVGVYRNNLAYTGTLLSNSTGADASNDSWDSSVTVSDADFTGVSSVGMDGPRQADGSLPVLPFMHLAAGSDLIDKGKDVGLPFVGTAPDLGAFEYGATTPTGGGTGAAGATNSGGAANSGGAMNSGGANSGGATNSGGGVTVGAGGSVSNGGASAGGVSVGGVTSNAGALNGTGGLTTGAGASSAAGSTSRAGTGSDSSAGNDSAGCSCTLARRAGSSGTLSLLILLGLIRRRRPATRISRR